MSHYKVITDGDIATIVDREGVPCVSTYSAEFAADLVHCLSAGSGQRLMQQMIDLPTVVACVVDSPEELGS